MIKIMNRSTLWIPLLLVILILLTGYYYGHSGVDSSPRDQESDENSSPVISDPVARSLNEQGLLQYNSGQFEPAEEKFKLALDHSPHHPLLLRNLVNTYISIGKHQGDNHHFDEAISAFEKAIELNPGKFQAHLGAGWIYLKMDKMDDSVKELEEAIRLDSKGIEAYLLLGEAYYKKDDSEKALQALKTALSLSPNDEVIKKRIAEITRDRDVESRFGKTSSAHFLIKFEGDEIQAISQTVAEIMEEAYQNIGSVFFTRSYQPIIVILYSNEAFRQSVHSPGWAAGIYDGKIRIPVQGSEKNIAGLKRVLFHEYTHAVIHQIASGAIPTWLNEGLAMYYEGPSQAMLRDDLERARQSGTLIPLPSLHGNFLGMNSATANIAYAESELAVQALINRYGVRPVRELVERTKGLDSFPADFEQAFFLSYDDFQKSFLSSIAS